MSRLTRTDILAAYELLLGRPPENEAVVAAFMRQRSAAALIREFTSSAEFHKRWKASPSYGHNAAIDVEAILRAHDYPARQAVAGHIVNFLGVATNVAFVPFLETRAGMVEGPPIPANWHADMAEFAAALRAVDLARDRFTMIELGCGWGCWMTNTGVAAKRRGLAIRLIGVEGDEGHLAFAREALATNGIAAEEYALFRGAAGAAAGVALFPRQSQSGEDWGLEPEFAPTLVKRGLALATGRYRELPVIALVDIIGDEDEISLLHMDIQGGEADLVRDSLQTLTRKVAYLVIGTHSRAIEGRLMTLLLDAGWALEVERPSIFEITPKGPVTSVDGVQGWRNMRLAG